MKRFFVIALVLLVALSGVSWWIKPSPVEDGKILLTWCSDDNPARREQIALFNRLHPQYWLRLDPVNSSMEKVIVQSLAGVGPDLFDTWASFQTPAHVKSGARKQGQALIYSTSHGDTEGGGFIDFILFLLSLRSPHLRVSPLPRSS